jgi:hypothetical protein
MSKTFVRTTSPKSSKTILENICKDDILKDDILNDDILGDDISQRRY